MATLGWTWTAIAGGGGLLMLIREGPWPLTNGWFALASGLCACPATACFIAGRIALALGRGSNG